MKERIIRDVMKAPEREVRTLSKAVRTPVAKSDTDAVSHLSDKASVAISKPLETAAMGGIEIEHGFQYEDYVWHIQPHRRRKWQVSIDRVIVAAIRVLNGVIPKSVDVNVIPPNETWDIKVLSFKALDIQGEWNCRPADLKRATNQLLDVLSALV